MQEPLIKEKKKGNQDIYLEMRQINTQTIGNTEYGMVVLKEDREILEKATKDVPNS